MATGTRTKYSDCRPGLIEQNLTKDSQSFEDWFAELKQVAEDRYHFKSSELFNGDDWREFYESGNTPEEAIIEDLGYFYL